MKLFSDTQPRHVLCILGKDNDFARLRRAIQSSIDDFARDFEIDDEYSQGEADERMEEAFHSSWDRVVPEAWSASDDASVVGHGCVIYVVGPHMMPEDAVATSATALRLVVEAFGNDAVAVKGESAGVAHGVDRWQELGRLAEQARGPTELGRICRLAFARRPISDKGFLFSVGFHLVGLPEVYVSIDLSHDEIELVSIIDHLADEMLEKGVEHSLTHSGRELRPVEDYEEDDFMYNPYGAVHLILPH